MCVAACAFLLLLLMLVLGAGLHSSLKQLDLSFNQLGDRAARALAQIMAAVPLLAMELEGNQVGGCGCAGGPLRGGCWGSALLGSLLQSPQQCTPGLVGVQHSVCSLCAA